MRTTNRHFVGFLAAFGLTAVLTTACRLPTSVPLPPTVAPVFTPASLTPEAPTITVEPTRTLTPAPTITPVPSATLPPSPTWPPLVKINHTSVSPNGEWTVTAEYELGGDRFSIRVFNDERDGWIYHASSQDTWDIDGVFWTHRWSQDGRYLYFVASPGPGRDRCFWYGQAYALLRMDLEDGRVGVVFKVERRPDGFIDPTSLSLSPDGGRLAYAVPYALVIRNLTTGIEQRIPMDGPYGVGGSYVWAPDGNELVLALVQYGHDPCAGPPSLTWIAKVDVLSSQLTVVSGPDSHVLDPLEWVEADWVVIGDRFYPSEVWRLNLEDGSRVLVQGAAEP